MDYPPPSSSSSIALSPRSPGNGNGNVFRPRRSDDWHEHRDKISQLYRIDHLRLRDVRDIMERDHNFSATEKQYKDRLAAWHIGKNLKTSQVKFMIAKERKRAARGKKTAFRLHGQDVDPRKVARFARRKGLTWEPNKAKQPKKEERESPEPPTPPDIEYYTPEPAESSPPISPSDAQSPTREPSIYALNYDPTHLESIPDVELADEDQPYPDPASLHANSPHPHPQPQLHPHPHHPNQRIYHHPPEPLLHSLPPQVQPLPHLNQHLPHPHQQPYTLPLPHQTHHQLPSSIQLPPSHPGLIPTPPTASYQHREPLTPNAGEIIPPPDSWSRLDAFQNHLERLQTTLNRSMQPWARDGDPHQEVNYHEGSGM